MPASSSLWDSVWPVRRSAHCWIHDPRIANPLVPSSPNSIAAHMGLDSSVASQAPESPWVEDRFRQWRPTPLVRSGLLLRLERDSHHLGRRTCS